MIARLLVAVVAAVVVAGPTRLRVATPRGEVSIPLWEAPGDGPMIPLLPLASALGGTVKAEAGGSTLSVNGGVFRFRVGMTLVSEGNGVRSLPAAVRSRRDSLYIPLAFVAEVLADPSRKAWSWSPASATLGPYSAPARGAATTRPTVATAERSAPPPTPTPAPATAGGRPPVTGAGATAAPVPTPRKARHQVTIDPGHGGVDPGNEGRGLPRGMYEKHVTLAVGLLLRDELKRRGVDVVMTRTTDTLINLLHRAPRFCGKECDLFVSLHVNSLDVAPGYTRTRGFETFFLSPARTADAARVARMENSARRYEVETPGAPVGGGLDFILKDLQTNEFLRASGKAASLMQESLRGVHSGPDRGVKQANFAVLTTALSPAVLVEIGFSTNDEDARMMSSQAGQVKLAGSIADAIMAYLKYMDTVTDAEGTP